MENVMELPRGSPQVLPKPYITFNPGMLDDEDCWTYRDLQTLAKKLGVKGNGSREKLVQRLTIWHQTQFNEQMNIRGSNFSLLEVDVEEQKGKISPRMMSPLRVRSKRDVNGSVLGILSQSKLGRFNSDPTNLNTASQDGIAAQSPAMKVVNIFSAGLSRLSLSGGQTPTPTKEETPTPTPNKEEATEASHTDQEAVLRATPSSTLPMSKQKRRLSFSLFNEVQLIHNRHVMKKLSYKTCSETSQQTSPQ